MPSDRPDLRVTLQQLEIFVRVVELEGVTRVAEERHVAQPSITGHLQTLQRRLGAKLIYWDGRQMHLTEAGEVALSWARTVLEETDSLGRELSDISSGAGGSVIVGASPTLGTYLLPSILVDIRQSLPGVHLSLRILDPTKAAAHLEKHEVDCAVISLDAPPSSARVIWRRTGTDTMVLVAAPGAFSSQDGSMATICTLPFVCAAPGQNFRQMIDSHFSMNGAGSRNIVMECGTPETIMAAARRGVGVAYLSRHAAAADIVAGTLVELPSEIVIELPVLIGFPANARLSAARRAVLDRIVESLTVE